MLDNFFAGISDSWVISWFFGHHNFRRSPAAAKAVLWGLFWVVFLWSGGLHLVDSSFLISKFYFYFLLRHNFSKFIFKIYFWFWVSFFYFSFLFLNFYFCVCVSFFYFLNSVPTLFFILVSYFILLYFWICFSLWFSWLHSDSYFLALFWLGFGGVLPCLESFLAVFDPFLALFWLFLTSIPRVVPTPPTLLWVFFGRFWADSILFWPSYFHFRGFIPGFDFIFEAKKAGVQQNLVISVVSRPHYSVLLDYFDDSIGYLRLNSEGDLYGSESDKSPFSSSQLAWKKHRFDRNNTTFVAQKKWSSETQFRKKWKKREKRRMSFFVIFMKWEKCHFL